jgi:hypothetical protein
MKMGVEVENGRFIFNRDGEKGVSQKCADAGSEPPYQHSLRLRVQSKERKIEDLLSSRSIEGGKVEAKIQVKIQGWYKPAEPDKGKKADVEDFSVLLVKEDCKVDVTNFLEPDELDRIKEEYLDFLRETASVEDLELELLVP